MTQDMSPGMRQPQRPRIITGFWLKALAAIAVGALLSMSVTFLQKYNSEQIKLQEYFIDIDGDGDIDYVKEATVILNCGSKACQPVKATKVPTPAPQVPQEAPPTPPVG